MAMQEADKQEARELLIKAKVYRILAAIFALGGIVVFLALYSQFYADDPMHALQDPMIIIFVVFPFIPSIILSLKAKRFERALSKLLTPGG
jgi:FtsH-binding integral membrane protein